MNYSDIYRCQFFFINMQTCHYITSSQCPNLILFQYQNSKVYLEVKTYQESQEILEKAKALCGNCCIAIKAHHSVSVIQIALN